ncbi:hypothetical protein EVAR_23027_1 [Eumeta japonica]|uniref:Uncharacterized protein n=1 Tax=Eumeta variegata TaxID=151549 RepID=A0A4C1URF8_EUMVA|nr:hypothetical protein EVAR_23027_1 [Eumeta japonica]
MKVGSMRWRCDLSVECVEFRRKIDVGTIKSESDRRHPRGDDVRHRQLTCSQGTGRVGLLQTAVTLAVTTSATDSSRALRARGAWGCYRPPSPSRRRRPPPTAHVLSGHGARGAATDRRHPRGDDVRHRQLTCSQGTGRVGLPQTAVTLAVTTSATDSSRALEARGAWGCYRPPSPSRRRRPPPPAHVLSRHGARGAATDRRHPRGDDVRHRQLTCSRGTGRVAADRRHPRGDDVRHRQLTCSLGRVGLQTAVTLAETTSATASSRALEARGAWGCYRPPSPSRRRRPPPPAHVLSRHGARGAATDRRHPRGDDVRHRQLTCSRGTGRVLYVDSRSELIGSFGRGHNRK